jgi:hypothetical protein
LLVKISVKAVGGSGTVIERPESIEKIELKFELVSAQLVVFILNPNVVAGLHPVAIKDAPPVYAAFHTTQLLFPWSHHIS